MKKVFIDCGFNKGQSMDHFLNLVPDNNEYEVHAFEPDPRVSSYFNIYKHRVDNITFHTDVVATTNNGVRFYYADNPVANTTVKEKSTGFISEKNSQVQSSVDLADFIKTNFDKDDYIILKIDIEGGEYRVLQHLYNDKEVLEYIDDLFVEFHEKKVIRSLSEGEHDNIIKLFKDYGFKDVDIAWEKEFITLDMLTPYGND